MAKKAMRLRERNMKAKKEAEQQRLKKEMLEAQQASQQQTQAVLPTLMPIPDEMLPEYTEVESPALNTAWSLMALNQQQPSLEQALKIQKSVEIEIEKLKQDDKTAYSELLYGQVLVLNQLFHNLVQEAAMQSSTKKFNAVLDKANSCQERCLKTISTLNKVRTDVPSQRTEYVKEVVLKFIFEIQDENGFAKWEGTVSDLLAVLTELAPPDVSQSPFWPKNYLSLGQQLKKIQPDLVKVGIGYSSRKLTTKKQPTIITLEQKSFG